ncbi:MAG: PadR family transcriptional regulator [Candidatus Aenigmarchaeota archaeon]|nr:PadR family transcriptional regulator [Candidatus Aenigmarchaeota archaeon]
MKSEEPHIYTILKLYTVLLLSEGKRHGYELIKELSKRTGKKVSPAQVYPFLKELEKKRYIKAEKRGEREKKIYTLTTEGKRFSENMVSRLSGILEASIRSHLVKCEHCGCEIYSGSYREKVKGKMASFCCQACAKAYNSA